MFVAADYLAWAAKNFLSVDYDLAMSGIPYVAASELQTEAKDFDDFAVLDRLSEAIARYNDVDANDVATAMGTSHAIFLAYAALISPGDEVLVEKPGYEPLLRCATGLGATLRRFERREEDGFAVDPDLVAAAITPRTRAIVVTNLHNPTGVRIPDGTLRELAAIAEARGAYLLVDEVYAPFDDLADDGVFRKSARKIAPNVVAIGSLTKCYGLGKHRVGWVLAPKEIAQGARAAAIATLGHYPLPYAAYGLAAFREIGRLSKRARALYAKKKPIAERWVRELPNARWSAPAGGLFGLVTLPGRGDLRPRIERLAKERGVIVSAGSFFERPESFRLSWASCNEERFREGLRRLTPIADAAS